MLKAGAVPDAAGAEKEAIGTTSHLEGEQEGEQSLMAPVLLEKRYY